jgi:hypothetical protein
VKTSLRLNNDLPAARLVEIAQLAEAHGCAAGRRPPRSTSAR